jgi:RHS repeat-associated protein
MMNKKFLFLIILQIIGFWGHAQDTGMTPPPERYYWYPDKDNDGYGANTYPIITEDRISPAPGYTDNNYDYDDTNPNILNIPPQYFYRDADKDGFGNPAVSVYYSIIPVGYVTNNDDCDDTNASLNPTTIWYRDADGDGFGNSKAITQSCIQPVGYVRNSSDYDDTTINITNIAPQTFYQDADGDGYGNPSIIGYYSIKPIGYVTNNVDCNDTNALIHPYTVWYRDADGDGFGTNASTKTSCIQPAGYVNNASDYNDTTVNITNIAPQTFYQDADGDGFGNPAATVYYSVIPTGYVANNADCNDTDGSLHPNTVWYRDADGDGFGTNTSTKTSCTQPAGYARNASDYDDTTANITNIAPQTFYRDADGDGFGNPAVTIYYSVMPAGYVTNNTDCNDADSSLNPNTVWYHDADGDGFGTNATTAIGCTQPAGYVRNASDCNDTIASLNPNTVWYRDADGDGFGTGSVTTKSCIQPEGYVSNASDYNDATTNITNIAPQTFYQDADRDGFGNPAASVYYSVIPAGYVTNNTDCNDADDSLNPNTKWYADNDKDGLGDPLNFVQQCTSPGGNYTRDNSDNCPLLPGTSPDCDNILLPSLDHNYIITTTYKKPTINALETPSADQAQTNITYFDGLGRPMQQIANKQSNSGKDIITHIGYDAFGRQTQEYLPYGATSSNMAYEAQAAANTISFYSTEKYENTSNPFSEKKLESSPLSRVLKQAAPGNAWAMDGGHEIKLDYQTNTASEVKLYETRTNWNAGLGLYEIAFLDNGNYAASELYKTITYDENTAPGAKVGTEEFKNKEGQVVLKRTYESGIKHDTYYVYDTYGNLTYVIPPKADGAITEEALNGLCYQYKYDNRNRLAEKKLPGKQWEFIVYDKLDRPVATGPANSPFKEDTAVGWLITKYDAFSRPIYTGWLNSTANASSRKTMQDAQNTTAVLFETKQISGTIDGIAVNYSNAIAPTTFKLLTVNYYDNYDYSNAATVPAAVEGQHVLANAKGLSTGSWTRALGLASAITGETTSTFYDSKARPIHTYTQNYLGGHTISSSKLDFTGKPEYTITKHKQATGAVELAIKEEFTYSPQDRLLTHTHQINGGVVQLLADNKYDELGQLISKKVGNNTGNPLQNVNYSYNIRGWLTGINKIDNLEQNSDPKDLFAFKINYNKVDWSTAAANALYNGNIAENSWITGSDGTGIIRGYGYQYDQLNRLKNATYQTPGLTDNKNYFGENLKYDKNGNIRYLQRNNIAGILSDPYVGTMDDLTYDYKNENSNQLIRVTDSPAGNDASGFMDGNKNGDDYAYDANGNMTSDKNKNITEIRYNHLNLPTIITFGTNGNIVYIYNATGQKLEKIVTDNGVVTSTKYLGGFQYKNDVLQFFPTAEGYVNNTPVNGANSYNYVFNYTDHLGNVRVSYKKNALNVLEILEENNYYPFGLKHEGYNLNPASDYKYKYNGKELQDELGLGMYDYGARNYDPALGRWMNVDPKAETSRKFSPYTYALNNPIFFIDPDGMQADDWKKDAKGNLTYDANLTAQNASTQLKTGETYIGPTATVTVAATEGVGQYNLNYNSDGSISEDKAQVPSGALDVTGKVNDVVTGIAGPLTKFGSAGNIASQTMSAAVNGAVIADSAIDGLVAINSASKFGNVAGGLSKAAPVLNVAIGFAKVNEGYAMDGGKIGVNTKLAAGGTVGSMAGSYVGAEAGAAVGAAIGVWFGVAGAVPGAIIGGIIGGIGGGMGGEEVGKAIVR